MTTSYKSTFFVMWNRYYSALLTFFLVSGVYTGILLSANSGSEFFSLMRSVASSPVSIVGSFCLCFIPFLLFAVCVHLHVDYIIPVFLWGKAFSFGFVFCLTFTAFEASGWLVHLLLLFVRQLQFILLIVFCFRFCGRRESTPFRSMVWYFVTCLVLCILDCFIISPFLSEIM